MGFQSGKQTGQGRNWLIKRYRGPTALPRSQDTVHVAPISDVVTGGHGILPHDPCILFLVCALDM